ncbi:MAG: hypothetical protein RLZZ262_1894, partial [Bacteroidota bacterium]
FIDSGYTFNAISRTFATQWNIPFEELPDRIKNHCWWRKGNECTAPSGQGEY